MTNFNNLIQKTSAKAYDLLRWSEQYTKTDMVYLARGGFWLGLGQTSSYFLSFLLILAFANLLPKETYGTYKYILSLFGLLGAFSLTGMNVAVTQAVARGLEGTFKKSFSIQIKWGIIMFLLALLGSLYYFLKDNSVIAIALLIGGSFSPILNSANTYTAFLGGKKEFKNLVLYGIISALFSSLIIFITIILTNNVLWIISAYIISNSTINIFFYYYTIKKFQPNILEDKKTISYGKHLSLLDILNILADQLDAIIIFHFLGAAQLAIYAIATSPIEQLKSLLKIIQSLAFPKFSEKSINEIKKTLFVKLKKLSLLIAILIIIYVLAAPLLFKFLFPKYLSAVFYSQIYALSLFGSEALIIKTALQSQKEIKKIYYLNTSLPAIRIMTLLSLGYMFGIYGIISAVIITRLYSLCFSSYLLKTSR